MAKAELDRLVAPRAQRIADQLGFELVDVCLDRENTGKYLRIYIDQPGGMDLNGCERFHRLIQPLVEDYDYDFLEVSSPGVDRPLKKDKDFERALGSPVEGHLFKAVDGRKDLKGLLTAFTKDTVTLSVDGAEITLPRKAFSLLRPDVDVEGVLEIEDAADADFAEGDAVEELAEDDTDEETDPADA